MSCRSVAYWPTLSIAIVDKSHLMTNTLYMFIILIAEGIQLSIQDTCQLPERFHRLCKLPVMYLLSVKLQRFVSWRDSLNEHYFSFSFYNQSSMSITSKLSFLLQKFYSISLILIPFSPHHNCIFMFMQSLRCILFFFASSPPTVSCTKIIFWKVWIRT